MPQVILVSREELAQEKWWAKLDPAEQRTVLLETQGLTEQIVMWEMSRLAMGKHFKALQAVLEPKRIFTKFCRRFSRLFSVKTIYRWIALYDGTGKEVPELVLHTAIAQGFDIINERMIQQMKKTPLPKTHDRAKIVKYLEKVEATVKEEKVVEIQRYTPEIGMKAAFHSVMRHYKKVPPDKQSGWMEELIGLLMTKAGMMKKKPFAPVAVPKAFEVARGRPRLTAA